MKSFTEVRTSYRYADWYLASKEAAARVHKQRWSRLRAINDQAYFLMMFGQLEDHVNSQCKKLVTRKKTAPRWKDRRAWDTFDPEREPFMNRVALLTDKGGKAFRQVKYYYEDLRCEIAHGNTAVQMPMALITVAAELQSLARALHA
ncbi:MAG: hypothetical protein NTW87_27060 [Planctomycetota bacterium]|nr:hypothetical protein [Planctomycetota bacterium]